MKKYLSVVFCLFLFYTANSQSKEKEHVTDVHVFDCGLYYMHLSSNDNIKNSDVYGKDNWNGIGIYLSGGLFNRNKTSLFLDLGFDIGWFKDVFMFNLPLSVNVGFNLFDTPKNNSNLMLHGGIGYFLASLRQYRKGNIGGYDLYEDEHLAQNSAFIPLGIRFYHKLIFVDFTYRFRFLKGKIKIESGSEEDYEYYYTVFDNLANKRVRTDTQNNRIKDIDVFPWRITIGFCL